MDAVTIYGALSAMISLSIAFTQYKPLTQSLYVQQTYSYIILALVLVALFLTLFRRYKLELNIIQYFASFILSLVFLFGLMFTSRQSLWLQHALWLGFVLCMSVMMIPTVASLSSKEILYNVVIVAVMVGVLSFIVTVDRYQTFLSWGGYLLMGLLALIVVQLLDVIFFHGTAGNRLKVYSWIGIVLFLGFVLYDTQYLLTRAKEIIATCGTKVSCANYPVESLNLFLDIINLFTDISNVRS